MRAVWASRGALSDRLAAALVATSSPRGHTTCAHSQRRSEHHWGTPTRAETAEMLVIDVILRGIRVLDAAAHLLIPVSTAYDILRRFDVTGRVVSDVHTGGVAASYYEDNLVALMRLSQNCNHLYMRELRDAL
ncbi:hypothetical protein T492DRAFT_1073885 [Pavlovales sp. CCMP2436]|nr:hypothetical protein T492DRAFT_1073885 [Pavlovales sp. CCMP2436]